VIEMATKTSLPPKQATALSKLAEKYNKKTSEADALRAELDVAVAEARANKGTFREIATLANRSVAWVQGSLERSKGKTSK
jgi:CHASE3 domain sensor protein